MRMDGDRFKPPKLDLLAIEPPVSIAEAPSKAPVPDAAALSVLLAPEPSADTCNHPCCI